MELNFKNAASLGPSATAENSQANPSGAQLADAIGSDLARPLDRMRATLRDIRSRKSFTDAHLVVLDEELEQAHRIAVHSQQLARLSLGQVRQSHEKLLLHKILEDIISGRQAAWRARGIEMRAAIAPVEILVDPSLLLGLLENVVDWTCQQGKQVVLKLELSQWPERGVLTLKASRRPDSPALDNLLWFLMAQTADKMEVRLQRFASADQVQAVIEFPRTAGKMAELTLTDNPAEPEVVASTWRLEQAGGSNQRVLIVTADAELQRSVTDICKLMGLSAHCTPTSSQAARFCELSRPRLIIIDRASRDGIFEALRKELNGQGSPMRMLEVDVAASSSVEGLAWNGEGITRIARESVGKKLVLAITTELNRA